MTAQIPDLSASPLASVGPADAFDASQQLLGRIAFAPRIPWGAENLAEGVPDCEFTVGKGEAHLDLAIRCGEVCHPGTYSPSGGSLQDANIQLLHGHERFGHPTCNLGVRIAEQLNHASGNHLP